ncbi:hypothetical protein JW921_07470 [Candidatus Fermentibacterales bacterium]|nr:hypothetical protein [Candidatus Fermentibacterales bacterium]
MKRDKARVQKLVRQAKKELGAGRRDEAMELLRKAISLDPEHGAVTEEILQIESELASVKKKQPAPPPEPRPRTDPTPGLQRRPSTAAATPPPRPAPVKAPSGDAPMEAILRQADTALSSYDEAAARSALKKLKSVQPDSPDLPPRLRILSTISAASKHVQEARAHLGKGDPRSALQYARKAFEALPALPELSRVLEEIEKAAPLEAEPPLKRPAPAAEKAPARPAPKPVRPAPQPAGKPAAQVGRKAPAAKARRQAPSAPKGAASADEYVRRIREKVQISALVDAASIAREGLGLYPDHELLSTFVDKFDKMGI